MFKRQRSGSVVCTSCGMLVGVNDAECLSCGRRNPGLWGFAPVLRNLGRDLGFTPIVVGLCGALYIITLAISGQDIGMGGLFSLLSPSGSSLIIFGAAGAVPVFRLGRWWTVFSASWLHAGLLHIVFNMMWVRQLGPNVAELYGPGRLVIIYTVSGVVGFLLSSLAGQYLYFLPGPFRGAGVTLGASASVFGLLGALVAYGRRMGSSQVHGETLRFAGVMFLFGLLPGTGTDNYAHAGGFAGGYLIARWLDPQVPERIDHLVVAFGCLVVTALSLVASVVHGVALFR